MTKRIPRYNAAIQRLLKTERAHVVQHEFLQSFTRSQYARKENEIFLRFSRKSATRLRLLAPFAVMELSFAFPLTTARRTRVRPNVIHLDKISCSSYKSCAVWAISWKNTEMIRAVSENYEKKSFTVT